MRPTQRTPFISTAWLKAAGVLFFTWMMIGCGPVEQIPTAPLPAGADLNGLWYSDFGDMRMQQDGTKFSGTFDYKDGGQLSGQLKGGVLLFTWVQNGDLAKATREVTGKGYLVLTSPTEMEGRWGYGDSRSNGGVWKANKADRDWEKEAENK